MKKKLVPVVINRTVDYRMNVLTKFAIILVFSFLTVRCGGTWLECKSTQCKADKNFLNQLFILGILDNFCSLPAVNNVMAETADVSHYRTILGGDILSEADWNETAVRKVLQTFAFGGPALDAQITTWADMQPELAIREMLTLNTKNNRLRPDYSGKSFDLNENDASLRCLSAFFSSSRVFNPTATANRPLMGLDYRFSPGRVWLQASLVRGLNPVRLNVGLFETNYHMAVNQDAGVSNRQIYRFYEEILNSLAAGEPYEKTVLQAAISAAVATQYNHINNVFENGVFYGNEDFGREFYQLFFGILGDYNPAYHEEVTIRNTAKALTGMEIDIISNRIGRSDVVVYGSEKHYQGDLEILGTTKIPGNNAKERLTVAASAAINHAESLQRLPVIIVRALADDNVDADENKLKTIRRIWSSMNPKNFLDFIRMYAISNAFHHSTRLKYFNSIERNILIGNLVTLTNEELQRGLYFPYNRMVEEDVAVFQPAHDVFGGQTGLEASQTSNVFSSAYNNSVEFTVFYERADLRQAGNYQQIVWMKDWSAAIPRVDGKHRVKHTAEWLWRRFIADNLVNFGPLEKAQVYALLASGSDFSFWFDPSNPMATYTEAEIQTNVSIVNRLRDAEQAVIELDSGDNATRILANRNIGRAINFITATPYFFVQKGID